MKRCIGALLLAAVAGAALAQAPFTIVRPADGSKVREKVRVLIPKGSVPRGGYVGIFLDGKFIEAVVPNLMGRYHEYILDTKGRLIPDGKHTLEAVLYVDYSDEPRIVDRSSVEITIANKANVPIPDEGLRLRYRFQSGDQWVYTLLHRTALNSISQRQQSLGGRAAELPLDYEKIRMQYAVENAYGNGDGLVRMQALPLKGKSYAYLTTMGSTAPKLYWDKDMHPIYMRLTSTGMEVFGSVPDIVPWEGVRSTTEVGLVADFPLPTLPTKPVKPGDVWQTRFQIGNLNIENMRNVNSVVESIPARGEFVGLEWESGHPCAKLKHTIASGAKPPSGIAANRMEMSEAIWFALDTRQIVKVVRDIKFDQLVSGGAAPARGAAPGGGGSNVGGNNAPAQGRGGPGGRSGGGSKTGGSGLGLDQIGPSLPAENLKQGAAGKGFGGRGRGDDGQPQGTGRLPGAGGNAARPGAPAGGELQRLAIQQIFLLED